MVSGGELYGAVKAEADMSKVYFHGNNKSDEEIEKALEQGVGCFVIDNIMECRRLIKLAEKTGEAHRCGDQDKSGDISAYP